MPNFAIDEHGFPVLLAEVPNAGVAKVDSNAKSGNPRHDVRSGKFGDAPENGNGAGPETPPNVDPFEFHRMLDAVRDAARTLEIFDEGSIREFLQGRAKNPDVVDVGNFLRLAQEQRKTDLVDILDTQLKGVLSGGSVRLVASRGFAKQSLQGLTPEEQAEVLLRLESKGHEREALDKLFGKRVKDEGAAEVAKEARDKVQASAQWDADLIYDPGETPQREGIPEEIVEMAARISQAVVTGMPQPIVNVSPQIVIPPARKKVVHRDENGVMMGVEEVEDDGKG